MGKQSTHKAKRMGVGESARASNGLNDKGGHVNRELSKVTLYVRPDQIVAIEAIQLSERKRTGQRPDKSSLVQEALDLLVRKYKIQP